MDRRTFFRRSLLLSSSAAVAQSSSAGDNANPSSRGDERGLWDAYQKYFQRAKYVSLSHTLEPRTPIWYGFDPSRVAFRPAVSGNAAVKPVGQAFTYAQDGFEATEYVLPTDQFGSQLDPPAHWNPYYPAIDELPDTIALRPLVIISIVPQVLSNFGYALTVDDIKRWERRHGLVPKGSVVMVRSDWYKGWNDPAFVSRTPFPGVSLAALQFLHLERRILFHGHEPLDTDATPTLEGEDWLMNHGYMQAEGVANLDKVPETGALLATGYPKFKGGTGGYASYVAICPPDWPYGQRPGAQPEAPLPLQSSPLRWDAKAGTRVR